MPETYLAILIGIGLSAACGFRVFIPLLVISLASASGHLNISEEFSWISSNPAITALAVAALFEVSSYFIPFVDNLMDTIAAPAAVLAGSVATASMITDLSPFMKWSLAIIAGGGTAGIVQSTTMIARSSSSIFTAGMANPVISFVEACASLSMSILAIVFPVIAFITVVIILIYASRIIYSRFFYRKT